MYIYAEQDMATIGLKTENFWHRVRFCLINQAESALKQDERFEEEFFIDLCQLNARNCSFRKSFYWRFTDIEILYYHRTAWKATAYMELRYDILYGYDIFGKILDILVHLTRSYDKSMTFSLTTNLIVELGHPSFVRIINNRVIWKKITLISEKLQKPFRKIIMTSRGLCSFLIKLFPFLRTLTSKLKLSRVVTRWNIN